MCNARFLIVVMIFSAALFYGCSSQRYGARFMLEGVHTGQTEQGMDVFGDKAYLLYNTGICRIFDLLSEKIDSEFLLASASKTNHANCASFGKEFYEGNNVPVLYVSECSSPYRCFVENIRNGKSQIVQTIFAFENEHPKLVHDWIVAKKGYFLYTFTRLGSIISNGTVLHSINKYRLPRLSEGEKVILSEKDVIDRFDISFKSMGQGGLVNGRYMYLPVGLSHDSDGKRSDAKRSIIIVDLKKQIIERFVDISNDILDEPEDIAIYNGRLLLYCGQNGGLRMLDIKM